MNNTLKTQVKGQLSIDVGDAVYTVSFPLSRVILAEEKLGRPLKDLRDWLNLTPKDICIVLAAGLAGDEPTATSICEGLDPEGLNALHEALCYVAWPKAMAELDEMVRKRKGSVSPNALSGDVS